MRVDPHELAEERSIALHGAIADALPASPEILERARKRVETWLRSGEVARPYAEGWSDLLSLPLSELRSALVDPGLRLRALRQVSPFAGAVDPRTRWRIWREVRDRLDREATA